MKKLIFLIFVIFISACKDKTSNPVHVIEPEKTAESYGCGNIFVYQYLNNSNVLTVRIDGNNVSLKKEPQSIKLDNTNPYIKVVLEAAGNDPDSIYFNFCNDVSVQNM